MPHKAGLIITILASTQKRFYLENELIVLILLFCLNKQCYIFLILVASDGLYSFMLESIITMIMEDA